MSQSWWPGEDSLELYFVYNIFLKICLSGKHADSSPNKKALFGLPLNCLDEQSGGGDETPGLTQQRAPSTLCIPNQCPQGKREKFFGRAWEEFSRRARKGRSWRSQRCSIPAVQFTSFFYQIFWWSLYGYPKSSQDLTATMLGFQRLSEFKQPLGLQATWIRIVTIKMK